MDIKARLVVISINPLFEALGRDQLEMLERVEVDIKSLIELALTIDNQVKDQRLQALDIKVCPTDVILNELIANSVDELLFHLPHEERERVILKLASITHNLHIGLEDLMELYRIKEVLGDRLKGHSWLGKDLVIGGENE